MKYFDHSKHLSMFFSKHHASGSTTILCWPINKYWGIPIRGTLSLRLDIETCDGHNQAWAEHIQVSVMAAIKVRRFAVLSSIMRFPRLDLHEKNKKDCGF